MKTNFWKIKNFSPLKALYAYVDHHQYLADALFIQRKIPVKFKAEMKREGSPYCIVFCLVKKKNAPLLEEALGRLGDKMLLLGHHDYYEICDEIAKMIDREQERLKGEDNYGKEIM